jgi:hypothetical protein
MPGARSGSSTRRNRSYVPAIKAYDCLPDVGDYGIMRAKALGEIGVAMGAPVEALAMYTRYTLALVPAEEHSKATGLGTDPRSHDSPA